MSRVVFPYRDDKPHARMRLFCVPYAGGAASLYRLWGKVLGPSIEVVPVELPGRGTRMNEAPLNDLPRLVEGLAAAMRPVLDKPYALFGHSMGAKVAFELARALLAHRPPTHLFVSASMAPQLPDPRLPFDLSTEGIIAELRERGGTPPEVFEEPELLDIFLPIIRADFDLLGRYEFAPGPPLALPVTAFGGTRDPEITLDDVAAWKGNAGSTFRMVPIEGDHFFIAAQQRELLAEIATDLAR